MPIIHLASTEAEAAAKGINVKRIAANNDGSVIMWTYETHHGLCIEDRERNGYNDSDWYMLIWDAAKGEPFWYEFASTRGWTYPCYASKPDATPEVMALYRAWEAKRAEEERLVAAAREAKEPRPGKTVKVVRGRKVSIGTTGKCTSRKSTPYGDEVGILSTGANGKPSLVFTYVKNVEVVNA